MCCIIVNSQNNIAIYKITGNQKPISNIESTSKDKEMAKEMLQQAVLYMKNLEYKLIFNKTESLGSIDDQMKNEAEQKNFGKSIAITMIGKGVYYQNRKENLILKQSDAIGELVRITDTLTGKWTLTKESKKIGKLTCYKAISNCKGCTLFKEVWFAPELNSSWSWRTSRFNYRGQKQISKYNTL